MSHYCHLLLKKFISINFSTAKRSKCFLVLILLLPIMASAQTTKKFVTPAGAGLNDGSSWTNALSSSQLRAALTNTPVNTDFWIAAGSYIPGANTSFPMRSGVGIYGGFNGTETLFSQRNIQVNQTIFSGNGATTHVVTSTNNDLTAIIDGITVTGGSGMYGTDGAGILVTYGAAVINHCR